MRVSRILFFTFRPSSDDFVLEGHLFQNRTISLDALELYEFRGISVYSCIQVPQLKAAED